jgi:hypothetical protein
MRREAKAPILRHDFGDVAPLVTLGDVNRFVQVAFFEGSSNLLNEDARLHASRVVHQPAVDHNAEGVNGKHEEDYNNDVGKRVQSKTTCSVDPTYLL